MEHFTWEILGVDAVTASMLVKFVHETGSEITLNLPLAPKGAKVDEWITAYSPFKTLADMSQFEQVKIGQTGASVPLANITPKTT